MKAQQIDMLLLGFGTDYALGTVDFHNAGLATDKDAYADKDKGSTVANPYTLDANGRSADPVYGDGWYKLIITKADATGALTFDNLYYGVLEQTDERHPTVRAITSTDTIAITDDVVLANATSGAIVATLADAATFSNYQVVTLQKTDATANTVTLDGYGSQTINGATTFVLRFQYATVSIVKISDTQWAIVNTMRESTTAGNGRVPIADASGHIDSAWLTIAVPVGSMVPYAAAAAPEGWLLCDGTAVSRTTYATLFGVIGILYGAGDATTTFNLPNGLGRTVIGAGAGAGLTVRACGDSDGHETHVILEAEMASHSHQEYGSSQALIHKAGTGATYVAVSEGATDDATVISTGTVGSNTAHNNMQPYFVGAWIIKY